MVGCADGGLGGVCWAGSRIAEARPQTARAEKQVTLRRVLTGANVQGSM